MATKTLLFALAVVLLTIDMRAQEPEVRTFMSKAGFYSLAPDITLDLEKAGEGNIRYRCRKTTNLADGSVHTLTVDATFDHGSNEKFFFYWDGAASTLWIASPDTVLFYVVKEDLKPGDLLTGMPSQAMFAKSPQSFRDELRKRFPDNFLAAKADSAISR